MSMARKITPPSRSRDYLVNEPVTLSIQVLAAGPMQTPAWRGFWHTAIARSAWHGCGYSLDRHACAINDPSIPRE